MEKVKSTRQEDKDKDKIELQTAKFEKSKSEGISTKNVGYEKVKQQSMRVTAKEPELVTGYEMLPKKSNSVRVQGTTSMRIPTKTKDKRSRWEKFKTMPPKEQRKCTKWILVFIVVVLIVVSVSFVIVFRFFIEEVVNVKTMERKIMSPTIRKTFPVTLLTDLCKNASRVRYPEVNPECFYYGSPYPYNCIYTLCENFIFGLTYREHGKILLPEFKLDNSTRYPLQVNISDYTPCRQNGWCINGSCEDTENTDVKIYGVSYDDAADEKKDNWLFNCDEMRCIDKTNLSNDFTSASETCQKFKCQDQKTCDCSITTNEFNENCTFDPIFPCICNIEASSTDSNSDHPSRIIMPNGVKCKVHNSPLNGFCFQGICVPQYENANCSKHDKSV